MRLSYPSTCTGAGEGMELRLVDESGVELSSDVPSPGSPTGNGGVQDFENGTVRGIRYGQTTLSRKVILKTTRYGAGCTGTMTVGSWNVVVVRSTP